ncbi:gem-associated protein 5-like [Mercenaria mercenaria]|uniref:gem-associated protein 5-like n=1 Tax=Mercenaria mercenaria TaxID=6596 RepID=UPI00234ECBAC|nr:gem-associated protein 5-like [Mercenaria mercenaria]
MSVKVISASPNWYCSKVADSNSSGILVFGARHDVYVFGCDQYPPTFKSVFVGHKEKLTALTLCEHEEYVKMCCSASEDGAVKLWNVEDNVVNLEHSIHSHKVTCICWSLEQTDLIVSGDEHGTVGVWQFDSNKQAAHRPDKGAILCMAASPYKAGVVAIGYKTGQIALIDVKRGGVIVSRLRGHDEEIYSLAWCPVPGEDYRPSQTSEDITDLESFGVEESWRKKPQATVSEDSFGTDGWLLASGSKDKTIRIWSTSRARQLSVLKLPAPGRRERADDGGKTRGWLTMCWLPHTPQNIVSSSLSGDILLWNITKDGKEKCQGLHAPGKGHSRFAFNLCLLGSEKTIMCSTSMDRQVFFWDMKLKCQVGTMPTFGGYLYVAKTSPFDPGRLALGIGDTTIRLLNLRSSSDWFEMTQLWQGIRAKVTALCWHPAKEGLLAYGTDDGRVGIYDTLSNKPPLISTTYHRRTVYVVTWGPPSKSTVDLNVSTHGYHVYSCGDGNILEHLPKKLDKEAVSVGKLIHTSNPTYRAGTRVPTRSEICWSPDFSVVAVGNDDGTVEVYSAGDFVLKAIIQVHHKLVNCVLWHPTVTMASPNGSPYKFYLALGSNESYICVVDLSNVFEGEEKQEPLQITESWRRLEGHSSRVTGLAWSPHTDGFLVSVSYDGNALVWNVTDNVILACYNGHLGKLLCCQWSGLDPGEVITGGDDFSAHIWQIKDHPVRPGQLDTKKKKKKKIDKFKSESPASIDSVTMETNDNVSITVEDQDDIEKLLEEKRKELMAKDIKVDTKDICSEGGDASTTVQDVSVVQKREVKVSRQKTDKSESTQRRKQKLKSMFPETNKRDNRGKQYLLDDLVTLAKLIYGDKDFLESGQDVTHLGLFLDRRATFACLAVEGEHHRNNENMDYFYQLEIWKGNINGALRVARQRDELSDWLVAMAPMASFDTWTSVCEDYAVQLESDGQYHKAASYFLACHKVYEAIRLFKRHKLFKEAIALAKARLSPLDPALEELYTLWAQQLTKDGNYEQAAKCHLAMKQVQDAAKLLARRYDQSSLRTAAHISMIGNDKQQGLMYTQKVVHQHLLQQEWKKTYEFLRNKKDLQVYLATSSMHEMLCCELDTLGIHPVSHDMLTKWDQQDTHKIQLPDFILDPGDVSSLSPWQLHLIRGHTFPHHVLRIWYSHFDIAMDTTSVEDMYKTLCLLHAGRQSQVELPQILIQVCTDLTLCMLSLMMSETPTAMSHLLQAVGSLHEAGHLHVLQGILRLFLPQGPKYILKLQQEVTAMRVMISMDTHSHVDGASKVHTIKRYLSEHKDESFINTSSLRCRELDCLRAYYYVAILNFLKESCFLGEATKSGDPKVHVDERERLDSGTVGNIPGDLTKYTVYSSLDENANADSVLKTEDIENANVELEDDNKKSGNGKAKSGDSELTDNTEVLRVDLPKLDNTETSGKKSDNKNDNENDNQMVVKSKHEAKVEKVNNTKFSIKQTRSQLSPVLNVNHYSITVGQLSQLAQGVLWDLQAKRYALTETLGYIHKAISQLLLSKNTQPSEAAEPGSKEKNERRNSGENEDGRSEETPENGASGVDIGAREKSDGSSATNPEKSSTDNHTVPEGAVAMATEMSFRNDNQMNTGSVLDTNMHTCMHHHTHEEHIEGHMCHSVLSQHFDQMLNIHVPHLGDVPVHCETETELKCSFFEVCSSCELLHKSRKILFEDEPRFHTRPDAGFKDMTNIINPAKYINVPDEWYSMPVDQKYFKRYITMAILKDEQEYVMGELKRGPDSTQSPFPNPLESVSVLIDLANHSAHISTVERQEFVQKVVTWALNFSVTTDQKQTFVGLLQSNLES